jgi:hypothetical protein
MTDTKVQPVVKNIYQKVAWIRYELVKLNLKKSGKNTYSNFTYFELSDFLPEVNRLMADAGVTTRYYIDLRGGEPPREEAVLEVINVDDPEDKMVFFSETANVEIGKKRDGSGGADPIQNLGGKHTYLRRYLHIIAWELVEADEVDREKPVVALPIDEASKAEISGAKTLAELAKIGGALIAKKGEKYRKAIEQCYRVRKAELEKTEVVEEAHAST